MTRDLCNFRAVAVEGECGTKRHAGHAAPRGASGI